MAGEDSEFTTELRGYKRTEVDDAINALRAELIKSSTALKSALEELKTAREQLADLGAGEAQAPSYAGLGGRLEAILRIAEEQSTRVISQADIDAERIIAHAKTEAQESLAHAAREAERVTKDAANQAANTVSGAQAEAEALVNGARDEAERLRTEAIEDASSIRGSVSTEAAKLRASAKRETDALRAEAKREISELRVVAERELGQAREQAAVLRREIDAERASHEITLRKIQEEAALAKTTMEQQIAENSAKLKFDNDNLAAALARQAEQARADLEAELSARRAEAEKELLDAHQKAVELNNRFLTDAESQLQQTKTRLAQLRKEQKRVLDAIDEANKIGKNESQRVAQETIRQAEARASDIVSAAEKEATARVAAAEKRLIELRGERDTIAEYIEGLRTVVARSLTVPDPRKKPQPEKAKASTGRRAAPRQGSAAS